MTSTAPSPAGFSERLTPAWWIHLSAVLLAVGFGLTFARLDGALAVVALLLVAGLLELGLWRSTPVLELAGGTLRAGRARVPVSVLGEVEALDADQMRRATGPGLDARAYLCLRGWVAGGVRVHLTDPGDPTPYWLLSSRRPLELAEAIRAARTTTSSS